MSEITFWQLEATKLSTHIIVDKKIFQGSKTKFIFENLILSQRDFVCWWNVHLNISDYLNLFIPGGKKGHISLSKPAGFRWRFA